MAYSYNPLTWQFDFSSEWEFYSKAEIDSIIINQNAAIADKLTKNSKNWTFTTSDWKTITVVDGQITNIV